MEFDIVLFGKLILILSLTVLGSVWTFLLKGRETERFLFSAVKLCYVFLLVRIGVFIVLFVFLKFEVQSDVINYYNWAILTNTGRIPGEDADLPLVYGPLFFYAAGACIKIWNDPKIIIILSVISEFVSFVIWLSLTGIVCDNATMKRAAKMYAFCPLSILAAAVNGNNDVFAGMFVSIFVALAFWNRPMLSGITAGVAVIASKALPAIAGLSILLASDRKLRWLLGAALPIALVYGVWEFIFSINVLAGFRFHGTDYSSGNAPFWISLFGPNLVTFPGRWLVNGLGAVLVLAASSLPFFAFKSFAPKDIVPVIVATTLMFMIVSAKSFPHYLLIALFPIMIVISQIEPRSSMVIYGLFSFLTSIESSLWFRIFNNAPPVVIWETASWDAILFFGILELGLLVTYGIILWRSIEPYIGALLGYAQKARAGGG